MPAQGWCCAPCMHQLQTSRSSTAAKLSCKRSQCFSSDPSCVSGCCCSSQQHAQLPPWHHKCAQAHEHTAPRCRPSWPLPAVPPGCGCLSKLQRTSSQASPRTPDCHRKLHEGVCSKQTQISINIRENLNIGIFAHVCKHLTFLQKSESTHVLQVPVSFQLTDCSSKTSATISIMSKPR